MADKKISDLKEASSIDHDKDYVLAARDGDNYKLRVGAIISDAQSQIPIKVSQLINDVGYINTVPNEYITEAELNAKKYLTQHQDLSAYAKKTDLPVVPTKVSDLTNDSGFINKIPDEYITESELNAKGYLTEHQDLSNYALKSEVATDVSQLNNDVKYVTEKQLTDKDYATENYVDTAISDVRASIKEVDLSEYAKTSAIPTKVSQLTNDKGYITSVPAEYITESELAAKGYITSIPSEYVTESELNAKSYATQTYVSQQITNAGINYSTTSPKAAGTASVGTESAVSRGDHVHPAQTTVSGNAGSATKLATARTINGTSFDGTANITTSNWGTARNLTIGNKTQSVNGSGNVTWTLSDIGAATSGHTHSGVYSETSHTHSYLPLSGGTVSGDVTITGNVTVGASGATKWMNLYADVIGDTIIADHGLYVSSLAQWEVLHEGNYEEFVPKSSADDQYDAYVWLDSSGKTHVGNVITFHNGIYDENGESPKIGGGCTEIDGTPENNILYVYARLCPWTVDYFDLGDSNFSWYYCYAYGGVKTGSDRTMKENINYIRNNGISMLSLEDDEGNDSSGITYSDMYNFIKEDLELATYNFKDKPEDDVQMNFIAQDLLYNLDGTDNKVGQFIVKPIAPPSEKDVESEISRLETQFNRELTDNEKDRIGSPKLDYNQTNFTSVLAGALKEAINKIEEQQTMINNQQELIDNLIIEIENLKNK